MLVAWNLDFLPTGILVVEEYVGSCTLVCFVRWLNVIFLVHVM